MVTNVNTQSLEVSEMAEITVFDLCSLYIEHDEEVIIWNVQGQKILDS